MNETPMNGRLLAGERLDFSCHHQICLIVTAPCGALDLSYV